MIRTTIMLPSRLKTQAQREARRRGMSLGEFIRASMEGRLAKTNGHERDPLFADNMTFKDDLPGDVSSNLDRYLDQAFDEETRRWSKR
jgi:hypothetical protein